MRGTWVASLGIALLASSVLAASGCEGGMRDYESRGRPYDPHCGQYASCGTCTPALGCGWCFTGTTGLCVADPSDCPMASTTGWTWEPSGCHAAADAGVVVTADAAVASDAGTASDAGATSDAGDAGATSDASGAH